MIESILLGIPIPPVFVSQRDDGVWDVVDGLQRLSSILEFAGLLRDENENSLPAMVLEKTKYLPSLDGKKWDDPNDEANSFTTAQRLYIKRAKIDVTILEKESNEIAKYELFQRLNTGGSLATPQEIRNCIMVMYNKRLYEWVRELANYQPFKECIALTDRAIEEQYNLELVLRFVVFRTMADEGLREVRDVGGFMTDRMVEIAQNPEFDYEEEMNAFKTTFDLLHETVGSNSFRRYITATDKFTGGFLVSPYETVALGIGFNFQNLREHPEVISLRLKSIWENDIYTRNSGSGIPAAARLPRIVPLGRRIFDALNE